MCHLFKVNFSCFQKRPDVGEITHKSGLRPYPDTENRTVRLWIQMKLQTAKVASVRHSVSPSTDGPVFLVAFHRHFSTAQEPTSGLGRLIAEVSRSHTIRGRTSVPLL